MGFVSSQLKLSKIPLPWRLCVILSFKAVSLASFESEDDFEAWVFNLLIASCLMRLNSPVSKPNGKCIHIQWPYLVGVALDTIQGDSGKIHTRRAVDFRTNLIQLVFETFLNPF
jgi:hypothetical protein